MALSSQTTRNSCFVAVFSTGDEAAAVSGLVATSGQGLRGLTGIALTLEAASGQTLSGAGVMHAYLYDGSPGAPGAWVPMPDANISVPASAASKRRVMLSCPPITVPRGMRLFYIPVGVTLSSGGLTVYQHAWGSQLEGTY